MLSWKSLERRRGTRAYFEWMNLWILVKCLKLFVLYLIVTEQEIRVLIKAQCRDPALEFAGLTKLIEKHCFLECEPGT